MAELFLEQVLFSLVIVLKTMDWAGVLSEVEMQVVINQDFDPTCRPASLLQGSSACGFITSLPL